MVVSADGGVGPYAYSWEPGVWTPSGASQFTLSAGPNTVMVMDDLGAPWRRPSIWVVMRTCGGALRVHFAQRQRRQRDLGD